MSSERQFRHHMIKEIFEQPRGLRDTIAPRVSLADGLVRLEDVHLSVDDLRGLHRINIVASGTSRHAGMAGQFMIQELSGVPVDVDYASEFEYRNPLTGPGELAILITQSGETADTTGALREAKAKTCSRKPEVRLFLVAVALVLRNVWVWLHYALLSTPRRGGRLLNEGRLRFKAMLLMLLQLRLLVGLRGPLVDRSDLRIAAPNRQLDRRRGASGRCGYDHNRQDQDEDHTWPMRPLPSHDHHLPSENRRVHPSRVEEQFHWQGHAILRASGRTTTVRASSRSRPCTLSFPKEFANHPAKRNLLHRDGVGDAMCYNCGCKMPDNPMGAGHAGAEPGGKSITNKTFEEAGKSMEESTDESKRNALDLLKKVLGEKRAKIVKDPSGFDRYDDA